MRGCIVQLPRDKWQVPRVGKMIDCLSRYELRDKGASQMAMYEIDGYLLVSPIILYDKTVY